MRTREEEADKWFSTHLKKAQAYFDTMRKYPLAPENMVKVAVIDTGIDLDDPFFEPYRQRKQLLQAFCYDAVDGKAPIIDSTSHGTQCVNLLLKTAPNERIYVARVFDSPVCSDCGVSRIQDASILSPNYIYLVTIISWLFTTLSTYGKLI